MIDTTAPLATVPRAAPPRAGGPLAPPLAARDPLERDPAAEPELPVRSIGLDDIRASLAAGWADFRARPTTAIFLMIVYPFIGLLLYRFAFQRDLLPLLFPMASGFALIGPIAAAGVYDLSRSREHGATELDGVGSFGRVSSGRMLPLVLVGLALLTLYLVWIGVANAIWASIMGEYQPATLHELSTEVIGTTRGWVLAGVGCGVGFLFALVALAIGAFSLPAIVDRGLGAPAAINFSVRAFVENPATMLAWGAVVAAGLILGSIPLFLGLTIVLPVFGHATWHLYRRVTPPPT